MSKLKTRRRITALPRRTRTSWLLYGSLPRRRAGCVPPRTPSSQRHEPRTFQAFLCAPASPALPPEKNKARKPLVVSPQDAAAFFFRFSSRISPTPPRLSLLSLSLRATRGPADLRRLREGVPGVHRLHLPQHRLPPLARWRCARTHHHHTNTLLSGFVLLFFPSLFFFSLFFSPSRAHIIIFFLCFSAFLSFSFPVPLTHTP